MNQSYAEKMAARAERNRRYRQEYREYQEAAKAARDAERLRRGNILSAIAAANDRKCHTHNQAEKERLDSEIALLSSQLR